MSESEQRLASESEEEARRRSSRRGVRIFLICFLAITVLSVAGMILFKVLESRDSDELPTPPKYSGTFYEPVWGENITLNPSYMKLDRTVLYTEGGLTYTMNDASHGGDATLLYTMLTALMEGDAAAYNACFSDRFLSLEPIGLYGTKAAFAPQKIYETEIELLYAEEDDDGAARLVYEVTYKIYRNDGTYRDDVGSDAARPLLFSIKTVNGVRRIDWIRYVTYEA